MVCARWLNAAGELREEVCGDECEEGAGEQHSTVVLLALRSSFLDSQIQVVCAFAERVAAVCLTARHFSLAGLSLQTRAPVHVRHGAPQVVEDILILIGFGFLHRVASVSHLAAGLFFGAVVWIFEVGAREALYRD